MARNSQSPGQSQWQLIWRQFARNRLAVVSAVVIMVLIQASIWAPFLANNRPLYYSGINRFAYREAIRNCQGALVQLIDHRQNRPSEPPPRSTLHALKTYPPMMAAELAASDAQRLQDWKSRLETALQETDSASAIEQFRQLRKSLTADLRETHVELRAKHHFPVLISLTGLDVGFLVWSLLTFLFPVWRWALAKLIKKSQRPLVASFAWIGFPLLASALWWWLVPHREDVTKYKEGRLAAEVAPTDHQTPVIYQTVVWPPIPYGLAESTLEQKYQPPPWLANKKSETKTTSATALGAPSPWDGPHWLGTDSLGRDALSRMIWGGRVSLSVGVVSVSIYVTLGILLGAISGFFRGWVDLCISRLIEVVICFPTFFLILTIVALQGPSIYNIMIVIGLTGWTGVARLIRAEFLRLVDQEFVLAGRALGYSSFRLIFRHILPNAMAPVLVAATFGVAGAILTESALSFLGLGITIPIPSWGGIMSDGRKAEGAAQWLILVPGLAIFLTITCYNLVGEALRDASDPRLRGSR